MHRDWNLVDAAKIDRLSEDPPPLRLRLPESSAPASEAVADEREAWQEDRRTELAQGAAPDLVRRPSALVDHEALAVLKQAGACLETEPGGRRLGELVHETLAVLPADRRDLATTVVEYVAGKMNLSDKLSGLAKVLVRAAMDNLLLQKAERTAVWCEVPFAMTDGKEVVQGGIDLLVRSGGPLTVVDFKTDDVRPEWDQVLETLYAPQLEQYASVVGRASGEQVDSRLLLLRQG
jgi:ATP-dependent exoDNAse (exonuclease V) beta subunit